MSVAEVVVFGVSRFNNGSSIRVSQSLRVPASLSLLAPQIHHISYFLTDSTSSSIASSLPSPNANTANLGLSSKSRGFPLKLDDKNTHDASTSYSAIEAKKGNPPITPAVMAPGGPLDLSSVLFRNHIIFIG